MSSVNRQEVKYFLTKEESIQLQNRLSILLATDKYAKKGYYRVRSLYFDSINDIDLYEKLSGEEKRKKIRLRVYGKDPNTIKLELKDKDGVYQKKVSILLSKDEAKRMLAADYSFLLSREESEAKLLYVGLTQGLYRPKEIVEYYRRAFTFPAFETRITFDENIRGCAGYQDFFQRELPFLPAYKDGVILEVKFNGILIDAIRCILEGFSLFPISAGKYSMTRGG